MRLKSRQNKSSNFQRKTSVSKSLWTVNRKLEMNASKNYNTWSHKSKANVLSIKILGTIVISKPNIVKNILKLIHLPANRGRTNLCRWSDKPHKKPQIKLSPISWKSIINKMMWRCSIWKWLGRLLLRTFLTKCLLKLRPNLSKARV